MTPSIRSGQFKNTGDLMQALMALPPAPYIPMTPGSFDPSQGHEIAMEGAGITKADSGKPVLGTFGLATCMGVTVFNRDLKSGGIAHLAQGEDAFHLSKDSEQALKSLLAATRGTNAGAKLEVRISGPMPAGGLEDTFIKDVLKVLNDTANLTFLSADFRGKEYPSAVGIDTRRWNEGLLKGKSTAITNAWEFETRTSADFAKRIVEGMKHIVDITAIPPAPSYDEGNLFDARAITKFSARNTSSGKIERE
jgi:hypothetical protein